MLIKITNNDIGDWFGFNGRLPNQQNNVYLCPYF